MKAIAVLMSVYRQDDPDLFDKALVSVVEQRLPDGVESRLFLGVDGPIGDDLRRVIDSHRGKVFRLHERAENGGLATILNELLALTSDEDYLFRMDADDRSLPDRFAHQIAFLDGHQDIDILGTAIIEHDVATDRRRIVRFAQDPIAARRDMPKRPPLAHPTACFRRRVFETVGGYPSVPFSEDIALWFKCLEAGFRFDNLPEPLYEFTIGPNFWKRRSFQKAWGEYCAWSRGTHRLNGPTWRQVFPLARLLMRIGPRRVQQLLYARVMRRQAAVG